MQEADDAADSQRTIINRGAVAQAQLLVLLDGYQDRLYAYLLAMVRDQELALDIAQETFLRAYRHLLQNRPLTPSWLYKVGRNIALAELKDRQRSTRPDVLWHPTEREPEESPRVAAVQRALSALTPAEAELLYLSQVDGFTSKEIAGMVGARPGAIRMRLSRAQRRFREVYGEQP